MRRRAARLAMLALVCAAASVVVDAATSTGRPAGARRSPPASGVDVTVPRGWQLLTPPVTALSYPVDRLLLTSYPTERGGNCGPDRAERDLPPDGALIYLMEYRPRVGAVWTDTRRSAFPPRPAHFALRQRDLATYECWNVPSYLIRFRAADRPFQLHVALGPHTGAARRAQVLRALDSLRFTPLPPPPPDPYAGWHALHDETGDTLRTPPAWLAAVNPSPRRRTPPRTLFLTANRPLAGLPAAAPAASVRCRRRSRWSSSDVREAAATTLVSYRDNTRDNIRIVQGVECVPPRVQNRPHRAKRYGSGTPEPC